MISTSTILVKERVALIKLHDAYDLFDAGTGTQIGVALEEPPAWVTLAKFFLSKVLLPTTVRIRLGAGENGPTEAVISKGVQLFRASVKVTDGSGRHIGTLAKSGFSLKQYFRILGPDGDELAQVRGDWKGWNFSVVGPSEAPLGTITKKWAGLGKEMFTSADNYVVDTSAGGATADQRLLILCSALAIDVCFKETG